MKRFSDQAIWFKLFAWTLIAVAVNFIGCSPRQDRLDGNWQVESYRDGATDRLEILKNLNFGDEIIISFPDPEIKDGQWSITKLRTDTAYVVLGLLNYDKPMLQFSNTYAFITVVGPGRGQFIANTLTDPSYKDQVPLYFFDGDWKVRKQGLKTLELTQSENSKIYMILRRRN